MKEDWDTVCKRAMGEPLLLLAFNRPHLFEAQLSALRLLEPRNIYIAIDGPRPNHGDAGLVKQTRGLISSIDWTCKVRTLIREQNLGCRTGVSSAIDWFFQHERQGIILEDDILPSRDFFGFCSTLLKRFESDDRILSICGSNFVPQAEQTGDYSLRFSRFAHIWGWATWRRTWTSYRADIGEWRRDLPLRELHQRVGGSLFETAFWSNTFDGVASSGKDTWDAQLEFLSLRTGSLTVLPRNNLVTNIGFASNATHTFQSPDYLQPIGECVWPLRVPLVAADEAADKWERRFVFRATLSGFTRRLLGKLGFA